MIGLSVVASMLGAPLPAQTIEATALVDVASEVGLVFQHDNGAAGSFYMPEIMGAGGAVFDFDGDGDLDVLALDGGSLDGKSATHRLYRNDLAHGAESELEMHFVDVSRKALPGPNAHGIGAVVAHYDRDGDLDVYVTSAGENALWRNLGNGTFEDATSSAGVQDSRWSTTATFFDFDGDGWLDLFVGNYLDFSVARHQVCVNRASVVDYCGPTTYPPLSNRLWRNLGNGKFSDVSTLSNIDADAASTLGVVAADLNGDSMVDLYVANDLMPNNLLINDGQGHFVDDALLAGVAMSGEGRAEAGMGVLVADLDGRNGADLFVTHLDGQTNTLYLNDGRGYFSDRTDASGLGSPSFARTGFGIAVIDIDHDGLEDLFVANGAVKIQSEQLGRGDAEPFHQPNQLFRNRGGGRFADLSEQLPVSSRNSRGVASGDVNLDGSVDLVVFNNSGPLELLLSNPHSSELEARGLLSVGVEPPARALTATVSLIFLEGHGSESSSGHPTVATDGPTMVTREISKRVHSDGSYASASDPRASFLVNRLPESQSLRLSLPHTRLRLEQIGSGRVVIRAPQP